MYISLAFAHLMRVGIQDGYDVYIRTYIVYGNIFFIHAVHNIHFHIHITFIFSCIRSHTYFHIHAIYSTHFLTHTYLCHSPSSLLVYNTCCICDYIFIMCKYIYNTHFLTHTYLCHSPS